MARKTGRKQIAWKVDPGKKAAVHRPIPYIADHPFDPEAVPKLLDSLAVGQMYVTRTILEVLVFSKEYTAPPLPYVGRSWSWNPQHFFPSCTIAVYSGPLRVEESGRRGEIMRTLKHTFIINGCRYIVPDVSLLEKVQ